MREGKFYGRCIKHRRQELSKPLGSKGKMNKQGGKCAMSWGCHFDEEFADEVNEITRVYVITKEEWKKLKNGDIQK